MNTVDDYLSKLVEPQKYCLTKIRKLIKEHVPEAEEVISYGIPAFKYKGKYLVGYAAFKDHYSIFPASHAIEVMKSELKKFKISKGTVQFTLDNPIPESIIIKLVDVRLSDIKKGL